MVTFRNNGRIGGRPPLSKVSRPSVEGRMHPHHFCGESSMKAHRLSRLVGLFAVALAQACGDGDDITAPDPIPTPTSVVALSGDVTAHVPQFGLAIGDVNNKSEPGRHAGGRRELNWDGVPAQ